MVQLTRQVTVDELFKEKVKALGFEHLHHIGLGEQSYTHIETMFNHQMLTNCKWTEKIPEELKEEIAKYKLTNNSKVVRSSVLMLSVESKAIWPRTKGFDVFIDYDATNITIELPNKSKAYLWNIYKDSKTNSGDDVWVYLSFDPKDLKIVEEFLLLVDRLRVAIHVKDKVIRVYGGSNIRIRGEHTWDDLVLPEHIIRSVKDDLEFWMNMEQHYRSKKIPYRRGYLFEGPPGNGKTATARTILSMYDFTGFMFNFSSPRLDDSDLMEAFKHAAAEAPSMFVLEDIDRVFGNNHYCNITLECLFNCLDGLAVNEGLVVIATANHPETLDSAIRLRPGRFDVPVRFGNPDEEQRIRFFHKMFNDALSEHVFAHLVTNTEGMSMAFLKLVYETAGVNAFKRLSNKKKLEISDKDAIAGLELSMKYYNQMTVGNDRAAGFKPKKRRRRINSDCIEKTAEEPMGACPEAPQSPLTGPVKHIRPTKSV